MDRSPWLFASNYQFHSKLIHHLYTSVDPCNLRGKSHRPFLAMAFLSEDLPGFNSVYNTQFVSLKPSMFCYFTGRTSSSFTFHKPTSRGHGQFVDLSALRNIKGQYLCQEQQNPIQADSAPYFIISIRIAVLLNTTNFAINVGISCTFQDLPGN